MYHIKNDKRSIQSSQMIYQALEALMQKRHFDDITITELINYAKVGRTTFYRSFDTIEDVLSMKCDEKFSEFHVYLVNYYRSKDQEVIPPFTIPFLRFWYVNPKILKLIHQADQSNIIKTSFFKMISQLKNRTDFNSFIPENNKSYFVEIRFALFSAILNEWIRNDMDIAPDELAKSLSEGLKTCINTDLLL